MATLFYMLTAPRPPAGLHAQFPVGLAAAAGAASSPRAALIRDDGMAVVFGLGSAGSTFDIPLLPPRTHYVCAALGESHAVLVRDDGAAVSAGRGKFGECDVPELPSGRRFIAAAAGNGFSVLLKDDGAAIGFGLNDAGQLDISPLAPSTSYVAAAAGSSHTVLLRSDGAAVGFGCNSNGQCAVPELPENLHYTAAAAGPQHTVLIRSDGSAIGFGRSESCFLAVPAPGTRYITAAAGAKHSVLIRDDGAAVLACSALSLDTVEVPPLPVGGRYLAAAACDEYLVFVRNDGAAIVVGEQGCSRTRAPPLPAGTSYAGLKMRSWSPQLNALFPHSSRALVHSVLCTEKRRRQEGKQFVLPELLCALVLPFVVPVAALSAKATCSVSTGGPGGEFDEAEEEFGDCRRMAAKCALGHELEPYVPGSMLPFDVHCCDACQAWISAPDKAHRCHVCDYDLCETCQRLGINNGIRMPGG